MSEAHIIRLKELQKLRAERDALAEALKGLITEIEGENANISLTFARAALAKAGIK